MYIRDTQIKLSVSEYPVATFGTTFTVTDLPGFTVIRTVYSLYSLLVNISTVD